MICFEELDKTLTNGHHASVVTGHLNFPTSGHLAATGLGKNNYGGGAASKYVVFPSHIPA